MAFYCNALLPSRPLFGSTNHQLSEGQDGVKSGSRTRWFPETDPSRSWFVLSLNCSFIAIKTKWKNGLGSPDLIWHISKISKSNICENKESIFFKGKIIVIFLQPTFSFPRKFTFLLMQCKLRHFNYNVQYVIL